MFNLIVKEYQKTGSGEIRTEMTIHPIKRLLMMFNIFSDTVLIQDNHHHAAESKTCARQ